MYPVIKCESKKPQDIVKSLENSKLKLTPELNEAVDEVDSRIRNIEGIGLKGSKS